MSKGPRSVRVHGYAPFQPTSKVETALAILTACEDLERTAHRTFPESPILWDTMETEIQTGYDEVTTIADPVGVLQQTHVTLVVSCLVVMPGAQPKED